MMSFFFFFPKIERAQKQMKRMHAENENELAPLH